MTVPKQALHLFLAATLVFVNLACACASASVSVPDNDVQLGQHQHAHQAAHQPEQQLPSAHHVNLADAHQPCQHQYTDSQCPDCSSDLAIGCDKNTLDLQLSKLSKLGHGDDSGQTPVLSPVPYLPLPVPISTGPPVQAMAFIADSPVRRHDRQLK